MAEKIWAAFRCVAYEGDDLLGVFTGKELAIAECYRYDKRIIGEDWRSFEFHQTQASERHPIVFLGHGDAYEYLVQEIEINKPLFYAE